MNNDIEPIRALVHRYCHAVCVGDTDAWADTWDDGAVWNIGRGEVVGRDAIRTAYSASMELFDAVKQVALSGCADLGDSSGRGQWYFMELARAKSGRNVFYLAHYDDEYRLDEQRGWLFTARTITWHYQGPPDLTGVFGAPEGYFQ